MCSYIQSVVYSFVRLLYEVHCNSITSKGVPNKDRSVRCISFRKRVWPVVKNCDFLDAIPQFFSYCCLHTTFLKRDSEDKTPHQIRKLIVCHWIFGTLFKMQNILYVQVLKEDCENTEMEAVYNESLFQRWVVIRYVNSITCSLF